MKAAYVDSSVLVAISLGEIDHGDLIARLKDFDELFSSNLLEAELAIRLEVDRPASLAWLGGILLGVDSPAGKRPSCPIHHHGLDASDVKTRLEGQSHVTGAVQILADRTAA